MKIALKFHNEHKIFHTIKDAEKFLNEALYYAERVELLASFEEAVIYDKNTKLSELQREAVNYGEGFINVYQIFE